MCALSEGEMCVCVCLCLWAVRMSDPETDVVQKSAQEMDAIWESARELDLILLIDAASMCESSKRYNYYNSCNDIYVCSL